MKYKIVLEAHEGVFSCEEETIGHVSADFINTEAMALDVYAFGKRKDGCYDFIRDGEHMYLKARRVFAVLEEQ